MKSRTAALNQIRLTGTFGKASALTALAANIVLWIGIIQNTPKVIAEVNGVSPIENTVGPTKSWTEKLGDNEISLSEALGAMGITLATGAASIMLGNSRRRQIHAFNVAATTPAGASPPDKKESKKQKYWNGASYDTSYRGYRNDGFWDGYFIATMLNNSGRSSSSYGGSSRSSSSFGGGSSKNNGQALAALAVLALLVIGTTVSTWMAYKGTKLNFFKQPKINFGSKTDHLKLEPLP